MPLGDQLDRSGLGGVVRDCCELFEHCDQLQRDRGLIDDAAAEALVAVAVAEQDESALERAEAVARGLQRAPRGRAGARAD